jgi:hypothetical protein
MAPARRLRLRVTALGAVAAALLLTALIQPALLQSGLIKSGLINSAWAVSGKERLAADLELLALPQVQETSTIPKNDQKRTAKCLGQAIATDIPEADAAKLSEIFEGRAKSDPALQKKWFSITAKDAPARNAQVLQAVDKLCPDLGPYVKQMM